jgi:hypothetical protein
MEHSSHLPFAFLAAASLLTLRTRNQRRRRRPRLILHFDVNKTITMVDNIQKMKSEHIINDMIPSKYNLGGCA